MSAHDTATHRILVQDESLAVESSNDTQFAKAAEPARPAAGWDPYEVWRSRVLVPNAPCRRKG